MKELWSHEAELNLLPGKKVSLHRGRDSMPAQSSTHLVPPNEMVKDCCRGRVQAWMGQVYWWQPKVPSQKKFDYPKVAQSNLIQSPGYPNS